MEDTNKKMCETLKTTQNPIDSYPLITQLQDLLFSNPNQLEFQNWINFTINLLKSNEIPLSEFIPRITFISNNDQASSIFYSKLKSLEIPETNEFFKEINTNNILGPICLITPELGKFSSVGQLGFLVDEFSISLEKIGQEVIVISPYYENFKNDNEDIEIQLFKNIEVTLDENYTFEIYYAEKDNIKYFFLKNFILLPKPYPEGYCSETLRSVCSFCKASIQLLYDIKYIPSIILSNDWFTGLIAAYGKIHYSNFYQGTTFIHLIHNLDINYEGRLYPSNSEGTCDFIHQLDKYLLIDPYWDQVVINPSRCALIMCDQWGTLSNNYKEELIEKSPLNKLLMKKDDPFSFPNGILKKIHFDNLIKECGNDRIECKKYIQKKYFGYDEINVNVPIFSFIGKFIKQKGILLLLDICEDLINKYKEQINILVGGIGKKDENYFNECNNRIRHLRGRFPHSFYSNPNEIFNDNKIFLGSDFGVIPSLSEPCGIIHQKFFLGGTPVIAYSVGSLKDNVIEFNFQKESGNGFLFDTNEKEKLKNCFDKAINLFNIKEKYVKCRKNAFNSVVDSIDFARAWTREFYRLKGKMYFNIKDINNNEKINVPKEFFRISDKIEPVEEKIYLNKKIMSNSNLRTIDKNNNNTNTNTNSNNNNNELIINGFAYKTFVFSGECFDKKPESIQVCGSFSNWRIRHPMIYDEMRNYWFCKVNVGKGKIYYKYVVDGEWRINPKEATETANDGMINNVAEIL